VEVESFYLEIADSDEHDPDFAGKRSFCSWRNQLPPAARVARAFLKLFPIDGGPFLAEPLDFGPTLDADDYWLPSPPASEISKWSCCIPDRTYADVTASVQKAANLQPQFIQYRLVPDTYPGRVRYAGTLQRQHTPTLEVYFRLR
jgi:hypothetical protein